MKAFVSYSHKDADLLTKLHEHLAVLKRQQLLNTWTDRDIHAGGDIDGLVEKQIDNAELYLLLVSSAFIESDYCFQKEFARALARQKEGKAIIVPIIVRECDWSIPELTKLKALPEDGKAVISRHWHSVDEAFANVAAGLRSLLESNPLARENDHDLAAQKDDQDSPSMEPGQPVSPTHSKLVAPALPAAKELLKVILAHSVAEERGLTEMLGDSPYGPLQMLYIPNTTAAGNAPSVKKSILRPAIAELCKLGWLLPPEEDEDHRMRIYELNPEAPQDSKQDDGRTDSGCSSLSQAAQEIIELFESKPNLHEPALHVITRQCPTDPTQTGFFIGETSTKGSNEIHSMKTRRLNTAIDELFASGHLSELVETEGKLIFEFIRSP